MDFTSLTSLFDFDTLTWGELILRVVGAMLFGFIIGYDREKKNKPVDYRVYMIVAMTTCLLAIMGLEINTDLANENNDAQFGILRIVQGVLTGIGFLGGGAILKSSDDKEVIGMATGASIWGAGSFGMMLGFGFYSLALVGFAALLFILAIVGKFKLIP